MGMGPTKRELEQRVADLEDALEEARDLIDEVLGDEEEEEAESK